MRVTIIPSDSIVIIDGEDRHPLDLSFMADIHAVQWYDTWGEVEYQSLDAPARNERITSLDPYQEAIDVWANWVPPEPLESPSST